MILRKWQIRLIFTMILGEVRCQELEQMISSLEEERNKHISHIMTLEEKMSDLEVRCASLDARLNQRNAQLSDLQREITEKANEVIALEREVSYSIWLH